MRKTVIGLATALAASLPFSGVVMAQEITTIEVSIAPSQFKSFYEKLTNEFMQAHPDIKVNLRVSNTYPEQTQLILREKITGGMPDVAHTAYNQIRVLADRDIAVPLDSFVAGEEDWAAQGFPESAKSMGSIGETFYAMPFTTSMPVVFYNKNLIEKAGETIDPANLSWDRIIEVGGKVRALGDGNDGLFFLYKNAGWPFQSLILSYGGQIMTSDESEIGFNDDAGLQALDLMAKLGASGMVDMTKDQGRQAFAAGKLGFLIDASSSLGNLEKAAEGSFEVGVAIFPITAANGRLPAGGNAIAILSEDERKQQAAWEYVKFAAGAEGQTINSRETGSVPTNTKIAPEILEELYKASPNSRILLDGVPYLTTWYSFPGENGNKIVDVVENRLQAVFSQKETPQVALEGIAGDVKNLLPKN